MCILEIFLVCKIQLFIKALFAEIVASVAGIGLSEAACVTEEPASKTKTMGTVTIPLIKDILDISYPF